MSDKKIICCGRCDGVHDECVYDMVCDDHGKTGCRLCFGETEDQLFTIQDLADGKCAVKNDGTLEELRKVLGRALRGTHKFYQFTIDEDCVAIDKTDLPTQSVKDFFREVRKTETFNPQPHYDNSKGSLYKVATERGWNPYVFDVVKRLERGGKKDPLKQEIEKSIDVLKIWLKEMECLS